MYLDKDSQHRDHNCGGNEEISMSERQQCCDHVVAVYETISFHELLSEQAHLQRTHTRRRATQRPEQKQ